MDLYTLETYLRPADWQEVQAWGMNASDWQAQGWSWLGGGTWIFSQPQPHLKGLVDLDRLGWSEMEITDTELIIGATCPLAKLLHYGWPAEWRALAALRQAIEVLGSFKISHVATVGGNVCLALSVSTLAPVMIALDATYELLTPWGSRRQVPARHLQQGDRQTILQTGEVMRRIRIPQRFLSWSAAVERIGVASTDPALAMVVGVHQPGAIRLSIGAAIPAPILIDTVPATASIPTLLAQQIEPSSWIEDFRASTVYRQHITAVLIQRVLDQLGLG
jgi:CO/xanthine dehydrogenase FAD-binding subunit